MLAKDDKGQLIHSAELIVPRKRIFHWLFILKPLIRYLENVKGKVLDVGCGAGGGTMTLSNNLPALEFYGIDINPKAIKIAKRKSPYINFRIGNVQKLPYKDVFFSAVMSLEVLEHLENPRKAIGEIYRVLQPGGIFYFTTPLEGDPATLYCFFNKRFGFNAHEELYGHIQKFSYKQLKGLLKKQGFIIIESKFVGHYFNQLYRVVMKTFLEEKLSEKMIQIAYFIAKAISGIESAIFRRFIGLNVQTLCVKEE